MLKTSQQKDKEGKRLIKLFSVPCKPTKSNGMRTRNLPEHYPADWEKFKYYCIQDVNTEVDIYKRLKKFPMPELEWQHYRTNERINDRGVRIDTELVQEAITCDLMLSDDMSKKAYELTGLENPNSVSQLKSWLEERGIPMDTLGKKDVAQMITELDKNGVDAEALDMLKLRLQMAKSSVKKYQAAERCVCPDSRARGLFQFYGASRTGRYSGRNIQLQNLPQNHISTLDEARTLVKLGCFDMVESIYGNTPDVLSQLIRTMLIPKDGCEFIVADFSAIEARVLAWEAEEQWVLDAFQNGEDLYCATASQMFHAADVIVTYQVLPEKSAWLYANVSDIKNLVGDELVASAIKSAMAELGPNEVTNRTKIEPLAQQKLAESLVQKYGEDVVFVNKVVINDMNFEDAYNEAIQQKSIAQQNADKQKIENEAAIAKAEADKQVAITNAEAEAQKTSIAAEAQAEANRKLAESLSDTLIDYQKIQKWDGKLPTVSGGNALVSIDPAE